MDYQKILDGLFEKGWSMQLTCEKQGFVANFFHESIKQRYIPLPQIKGNNLEEVMYNTTVFFKLGM